MVVVDSGGDHGPDSHARQGVPGQGGRVGCGSESRCVRAGAHSCTTSCISISAPSPSFSPSSAVALEGRIHGRTSPGCHGTTCKWRLAGRQPLWEHSGPAATRLVAAGRGAVRVRRTRAPHRGTATHHRSTSVACALRAAEEAPRGARPRDGTAARCTMRRCHQKRADASAGATR